MNELEELYDEIASKMKIVTERHAKFVEKGHKVDEAEVRKALNDMKKLITGYRKVSFETTKAMKKR